MANYQDLLFSDSLSKIPSLRKHQQKIDSFLSDFKILSKLSDREDVIEKIISLEKNLTSKFANPEIFFSDLINNSKDTDASLYLSDVAIERILSSLPTTKVSGVFRSLNNNKLTLRDEIALTRFTESTEWQLLYLQALSHTTHQDYEIRQPTCIFMNLHVIQLLLSNTLLNIKPWGVSHNKETGVIFVFSNSSHNLKTPNLLTLSVFLHYLYEVHHFSKFLMAHPELKIGQLVNNIILSKEPMLPFLTDGNAHDETLYWRKALQYLEEHFGLNNSILTDNSLIYESNQVYSLNFIDLLWDINNIYPNKLNLYHTQQEVWLQLEEYLSGQSRVDFEESIKHSLMLDNLMFLEKTLKLN